MNINLHKIDKYSAMIVDSIHKAGGICYLVGGTVRDFYLNKSFDTLNYDLDIEVHQIEFEKLHSIISELGFTPHIQGNFGVIKVNEAMAEFAIPREENQIGYKHQDFHINLSPYMDIKQAANRRDFTCNALYYNLRDNTLVDNYNGICDINARILRHVSNKFTEDGLRVYRAIRFSSKLGMDIASETVELCKQMRIPLAHISTDRKNQELEKYFNGKYLSNTLTNFINIIILNELHTEEHELNFYQKPNFDPDMNSDSLTVYYAAFIKLIGLTDIEYTKLLNQTLTNKRKRILITKIIAKGDFTEANNTNNDIFNFIDLWHSDAQLICDYNQTLGNDEILIANLFNLYLQLESKYNGNFFITQGYQGKEIGIKRKEKIKEEFIKHLES